MASPKSSVYETEKPADDSAAKSDAKPAADAAKEKDKKPFVDRVLNRALEHLRKEIDKALAVPMKRDA